MARLPAAALALVILTSALVAAYPEGAADCSTPGHGAAQSGDGGYSITLDSTSGYTPGGAAIGLTLGGAASFRGFLIYATAGSARVGQFTPTDATASRTQEKTGCGATKSSWTHTFGHNSGFTSDTLTWTPPATDVGTVTFTAVVVQCNTDCSRWYHVPQIQLGVSSGTTPDPSSTSTTTSTAAPSTTSTGGAAASTSSTTMMYDSMSYSGDMTTSTGTVDAERQSFCAGVLCILWKINTDAKTIAITLQSTGAKRWMAVGFNADGKMWPSEVYVAWTDGSGGGVVSSRHNADYTGPQVSTNQVATFVSATSANGVSSVTFTRPLDPGNGLQAITDTSLPIIYSFSPENNAPSSIDASAAIYNKHEDKGSTKINFITGDAAAATTDKFDMMKQAHGSLMAIAWIVVMNFGIMIAKFYKKLGHLWYTLHWIFAMTTVALTVTAFVIALVMVDGNHVYAGMSATISAHKLIGLLIVTGAVVQPLLGLYINATYDPKRTQTPCRDMVHWAIGRFLVLLGLINVFLGLASYGAGIALYIVVIVVAVLIIGLIIYKQLTFTVETKNKVSAAEEGDSKQSGSGDDSVISEKASGKKTGSKASAAAGSKASAGSAKKASGAAKDSAKAGESELVSGSVSAGSDSSEVEASQ